MPFTRCDHHQLQIPSPVAAVHGHLSLSTALDLSSAGKRELLRPSKNQICLGEFSDLLTDDYESVVINKLINKYDIELERMSRDEEMEENVVFV